MPGTVPGPPSPRLPAAFPDVAAGTTAAEGPWKGVGGRWASPTPHPTQEEQLETQMAHVAWQEYRRTIDELAARVVFDDDARTVPRRDGRLRLRLRRDTP